MAAAPVVHYTSYASMSSLLAFARGWILISDLNGDRVCSENAMPPARFVPSEQLLPSLVLFCRSCLILAACNVSALYFLVQQGMNSAVLALALGMGIAHCLVLHQKLASWTAGIRNDQALEEGCLLRSPEAGLLPKVFGALAVVLLVGTGVAVGSAFAVVLMALALHTQQLHAACAGLAEWREPQIRCKEYHKVATELLPQSVELPQLSKNRALKLAGTHYFAACLVILAATALGLAALDSCQRRGELVDFSFDRGHLIYPAEGQAFHSTLLLDETVDSVVLSIQAGQNTQQIQLSLEHPLLAVNESLHTLGKEKSGEFQLFLPAGPLYSRISLTALAMGSLAHTSYVFHVLRRGDAVKVSIQGSFDPKKYPGIRSQFEETRRLSYLLEHPNWYIPDISRLNTNFAVSFSPVIFAPLVAQARASADAMGIADSCDCGNDTAGYGNACAWQKFTNISGSGARCIFSYKTLPELVLHQPGSVAGDSFGLASWLADVSVSGRSVAFLPWAGNDRGTTAESGLIYFNPEEASDSERRKKLEVTFTVSMPLQPLIGEPAQLLIATTADPTDAEATSIPVALIPHAPPIRLQPTEFLTPAFDMQDMQKDYAWCSWETVHQMTGHVEDERFAVEARRIDTKEACEGDVRGMEFQAVRVGSCMDWCGLYTPRAETYDLAVVRSGLRCLKNAVVANNFEVLQRVMSGSMLSDDKKACVQQLGLLGDAIRRNRTAAAKTLVEHKVDPSKASLGEMPLAIAAEVGNTKTLNFLLAQNVSVDQRDSKGETALFAASRHCRLESVKLLLGHHASANAESRQRLRDLAECNETVLVAVLKGYDAASCSAAKALDGVVKLLEQHGANFQARGCDFEGNMLKHSLVEQDLTVMRLLLERRVDVTGAYSEELVREMLTLVQQLQPSFLAAALKMLKEKGMDLDQQAGEYKETLLTTFALMCKVELVRVCLEEGASPSAVNGRGINASAAAAASRCRNKTAEAELLQLLADHSSSGDP
ncbi:unnamed protein product [Symbiodinium sp. CCMP2592]|nr:unnamed protein product [Symbiodinium sp. CCMP2592]